MARENQGIRDEFTNATAYNQLEYIIEQKIRQMVNTSAIVRVDSCTSTGADAGAGAVSATPLVAQTDADGHALPMVSIPKMPHARQQAGIAAIILDPVAGDKGVACFCKSDSSTVGIDTKDPQRPGSYRAFDQADGVLVATISNKAPEVWIELKQDKTIIIHAPEGCIIESDKTVEIKAAEKIRLDTPLVEITGNLVATGEHTGEANMEINGTIHTTKDQVANTVSQMHHVHDGVQGGSGYSSEPVK